MLGIASDLKGEDGADGREVVLRADTESGYLQWQYAGDEGWTNLISLAVLQGLQGLQGEKGDQGEAGRGIVSIEKTSTDGLVDTYTITYTDGTSDTFTVTNGEQGAQGIPGEKGEQGIRGEKGDTGRDGQDGADGKDGIDGKDGQDGADGVDGMNGRDGTNSEDGKDGTNGQTPYIGDNGNWWIGDTDTGKTAVAVSVSEITVDENGQFVFMMSDGTTKYAKMSDGSVAVMASASDDTDSGTTTRALATTGLAVSSVSLIWNIASLAAILIKKKKGIFPG